MKSTNFLQVKPLLISKLKTLFFFSLILFSSSIFAQEQYLWTGAVSTSWINANNWVLLPSVGSPVATSVYPGEVSPKNDIAIFTNQSNVDCLIDRPCAGTSTALRVGGIIVRGYEGTITQKDDNRFNVSDDNNAGGAGYRDSLTLIATNYPPAIIVNGMEAYQASFDFRGTSSLGFQGGSNILLGITPSYSLLFAVPFRVVNGIFKAPRDETRIRHNAVFESGAIFQNTHHGTVVLSNVSAGDGTRYYKFTGATFWDLKVATNGHPPRRKEFSGGAFRVEHDFMTTGGHGVLGTGSDFVIMNAPVGTEIHIKNDLIVGNVFVTPSFTGATTFGNLFLVMNGTSAIQTIRHDLMVNFSGNLPSVRIDKPTGVVKLVGPTTINNQLVFATGKVEPMATTNTQSDLLTHMDMFVVNSNTTVSGASDNSFCRGVIGVRTGKTIELPIGKDSTYRPAIIRPITGVSPDNSVVNMYVAEYFEQTPMESIASRQTGLEMVSNCEVWAIQKENNTTDPLELNMELSFDTESCTDSIYTDSCNMIVTRWDDGNSQWESHGNNGFYLTGHSDQTIRTNLSIFATDFERGTTSPDLFTLGFEHGTACVVSPCDIQVCVEDYCVSAGAFTFTPSIITGIGTAYIDIAWDFGDGTSTDLAPIHTFTSIGLKTVTVTVRGTNGVDTCSYMQTFNVYSNNCIGGMVLGVNKKAEIDEIITNKVKSNLLITPNPVIYNKLTFSLETTLKGKFEYLIIDNLGKELMTGKISAGKKCMINTSSLPSGTYIISVLVKNEKIAKKFIVVK